MQQKKPIVVLSKMNAHMAHGVGVVGACQRMVIQQSLPAGSQLFKSTTLKPKPDGQKGDNSREKKPRQSRDEVPGKEADNKRADGPPKTILSEPSKAEGVKKMVKLATPNIQAMACSILLGGQPLGVLLVYRAPHAEPTEDMDLLATVQEFLSSTQRILILGDFKLPEICWVEGEAPDLQNPKLMFADDVKVAGKGLEQDLDAVRRRSDMWDLPLNLAKCQLLTTRANDDTRGVMHLQHVPGAKDLGKPTVTRSVGSQRKCRRHKELYARLARATIPRVSTELICTKREGHSEEPEE
ncbi:unnamed protein product [Echinostoma caproni]|uniref:Endo/exonuclease/phosphatase domain-containing protein n=1 Tax=Echinostoma caproni TaxID=27848 RepID=A0A183AX39_9TREM|nr:unnamed protein product [Echinostoma caproni]